MVYKFKVAEMRSDVMMDVSIEAQNERDAFEQLSRQFRPPHRYQIVLVALEETQNV